MNPAGIFRGLSRALAGAAAVFALGAGHPAQAGQVIIDDGGACSSWGWSGSTLTCTPANGNTNPNPAPTTFSCNFGLTGYSGAVSTAIPVSLTCSGGKPASVVWDYTAPAGCQGTCTGTPGNAPVYGTSSVTTTITFPATGSWTLKATVTSDTGATSGQATVPVTVNAAQTQPVTGTNLCRAQGFDKTIYYEWDWAHSVAFLDSYQMADMANGVGLGTNGILVVKFVPTGPTDGLTNLALISATGFPAPNMVNGLAMSISTQPCDLNPALPGLVSTSTTPTISYGVGSVPVSWLTGRPYGVSVQPGQPYYINVAGRESITAASPTGTQTCIAPYAGWNCDVRLTLRAPAGH